MFRPEKSRIDCEIDLIFSLYKKTLELCEKNIAPQLKNTHDPEKWKKKFILVFNREKVIDFTGNTSLPVDYR